MFNKLPETGIYWKCMLGRHWNENKLMADEEAIGAFDTIIQFQNRKKTPVLFKGTPPKAQSIELAEAGKKKYLSTEADFFAK